MSTQIPEDLALKIIEKELELETNCSLQVLTTLSRYYKEAIEFYEEHGDHKHFHYQERLQKIFMRPNVLKMMQEDSIPHKSGTRSQIQRRKTEICVNGPEKHSLKSQTLSALKERPVIGLNRNDKLVTRMVESQHKRTEHVISRAKNDITSQETGLNERLANRKQRILNTSNDSSFFNRSGWKSSPRGNIDDSISSSFFLDIESDKSAGGTSSAKFHEQVEKIIEDSYNEKTEKISQIKIKYGSQITELEQEGEICMEIVKELKKSMNAEIEEVTSTLKAKRKEQLLSLKLEYTKVC